MNFYELFLKPYASYETYQIVLETIAMTFGILSVYFSIKKNIWVYPTGIISTVLYVYILFVFGLLGDMMINFYYTVMSIYGWLYWKFGKRKSETAISETTNQEKVITAGIVMGTFSLFWLFLTNFTDSDVPILDSLVSAFAWAGMWLMARRKIENWLLLNISNIIAIPLLIHKDLYLYAVLTIFLFIIAIFGYLEWRKIIKKRENAFA